MYKCNTQRVLIEMVNSFQNIFQKYKIKLYKIQIDFE